jgi:hypothetical protein
LLDIREVTTIQVAATAAQLHFFKAAKQALY